MFNSKRPFSALRIERLGLCILHPPQPLQVFDHLRVVFVLDPFLGGFVDRPTIIRPIPPSLRRSARTREGFVDITQIVADAELLVLKPPRSPNSCLVLPDLVRSTGSRNVIPP